MGKSIFEGMKTDLIDKIAAASEGLAARLKPVKPPAPVDPAQQPTISPAMLNYLTQAANQEGAAAFLKRVEERMTRMGNRADKLLDEAEALAKTVEGKVEKANGLSDGYNGLVDTLLSLDPGGYEGLEKRAPVVFEVFVRDAPVEPEVEPEPAPEELDDALMIKTDTN